MLFRCFRFVCAAVLIFGAFYAPAAAQPVQSQPPIRLTLTDAIARGIEASHRLAELHARKSGAEATAMVRDAASLPRVSLAGGYLRTNHVEQFGLLQPNGQLRLIYPDIPDNYRSRIDLEWPIYAGGRAQALAGAAHIEADAVGDDIAAGAADLRLEIARSFWSYLTAHESVGVVEEALKLVQAHLSDVRNRFNVGLLPPSDVFSADAQEARERVLLIQARNRREAALADLRRLTGLDSSADIVLDASLERPIEPPESVMALIEEARHRRPDREALEKRRLAADSRREAADAGRLPTVTMAGGFDYGRPNPRIFPRQGRWDDSWDMAVNATWSVWDGGRQRAETAEASAMALAAGERVKEFDTMLEVEVRQRRLDVEATLAAISAADQAVRSATEARRVISDRFNAGVATSTEVLDAEVALLQTQLERTRALADARFAEAQLARAVGR